MRLALLVALLLAHPAEACVHTALYGGIGEDGRHYPAWIAGHASGWPYLNAQGQLVDSALDATARFPVVILPAGACREVRGIAEGLKARNPDLKLYAKVGGIVLSSQWQAVHLEDTLTNCTGLDLYRACAQVPDWQTRSKLCPGTRYDPLRTSCADNPNSWMGTNWASYPTVSRWVQVMVHEVVRDPMFDGVFVDLGHGPISWSQNPRDSIDFVAMGFRSIASYDSAWGYNRQWAARRLRQAAPRGFAIIFNGPYEPDREQGIASMVENWPKQNGTTWESNWAWYRAANRGSLLNVLMCRNDGSALPDQPRIMRFALGTAMLGDGAACFTCLNLGEGDVYRFRIPEMDLDFGDAYGPAYQRGSVWRRDFVYGSVTVDPVVQDAKWVAR